ncbi:7899_t:CDS:2 [Funneliformis caledonium]|uniref:7899_t:CDS:1 n=1 Tax=Funneliformis caledonium TaxID=1117310 RepID=A0A9N9BWH2_9GLOM|nr:7899_t:CDS:2 [Funneliformis caledonium]
MNSCQAPLENNNLQGWVLALASGLACCLGASVVFSDLFFQKFKCTQFLQIAHNSKFLVASLSLGAGVMLFSSLFILLNEAKEYFRKTPKLREYSGISLIAFYFLGVIGSAIINKLIHHALSGSSIHSHHHHHHIPDDIKKPQVNKHDVESLLTQNDSHDERSPLLRNHMDGISSPLYDVESNDCYNETACSERHSVCMVENDTREPDLESLCYHDSHDDQHIHGLITFVTSQVSPSIGFALFFAIALHNISEGFTIALPLYVATQSRIKSFLYASLLGGFSQPFGALIGYLFLKESEAACWDHNFIYGALFSAVSGLMGVICIQGMLPQAIKHDKSDGHLTTIFFFLGVLIMGSSSALFDHAASFEP